MISGEADNNQKSTELYHWKYKSKRRVGDHWIYVYDSSKKSNKNLTDSEKKKINEYSKLEKKIREASRLDDIKFSLYHAVKKKKRKIRRTK